MSDIEYITKDNAIQAIFSFPYVMRNTEILDRIANNIRFTPSADVAPVVHGHWIEELGDVISCRCSRCDHSYHLYENDINGYPYCAWCGAKMDESEGESNE